MLDWSSVSCAAACVLSDTCTSPGLAIQGQQLLITHDVRDPSIDAPPHARRQIAFDQFLTKLNKPVPVDRGLFTHEDKEAELLLIHDIKRYAYALIYPNP